MKNLVLAFAVVVSFVVASCGAKKSCEHEGCKETCDSVKTDSIKPVVDSVAVDSAK
jgi:hypothetical protein